MEISRESLDFASFHLSATEKWFQKEEFISSGTKTNYQKLNRYSLNFSLDYSEFHRSKTIISDLNYTPLPKPKDLDFEKNITEQITKLYEDDTELAKKYIILLEFLQDKDPSAAKELVKRMDKALKLKASHEKGFRSIEKKIKKIVKKIQSSNTQDLQRIASRTSIKINVKLEITQKERTMQVQNEDRSKSLSVQSFKLKMAIDIRIEHEKQIQQIDPLVVDLDGDGFEIVDTKNGVMFDINGDGKKELTSWITGDDAFLALDRNLNGKIDNGKELFGDQNGAMNGFLELAKLDWDQNGILNFKDPLFDKLLLFRDLNHNGKSEKEELIPLYKAGIKSINLNYWEFKFQFKSSTLTFLSNYQKENGTEGKIGDFKFIYI